MSIRVLVLLVIAVLFVAVAPVWAGAIHQAALMGDTEKIKALATEDPSLVNQKDENGLTPLFWTVYADQPGAASLLIDLKAEINARDDAEDTPLHVAVALGSCGMVEALVSKGADLSLKDSTGSTPLAMAKHLGKSEIVGVLLGTKQAGSGSASIPAPRIEAPKIASAEIDPSIIALPIIARKPGASGTKAVVYSKQTVRGVPVNVITVNLDDARVSVSAAISQRGIGSDESFGSYIKRCAPTAAINGTFFSKTSLRPIGDIVIGGKLAHWGGMGTAFCLTGDCRPVVVTVERNKHVDWSAYNTVICCGPRLLTDGEVTVDPASEGFRDPHVLGKSNRTGVGVTKSNRLILANTSKAVSLTEWANIMKALGCTDALNFDGGASSAMYYRGKTIITAGRKLTNVLLVYER